MAHVVRAEQWPVEKFSAAILNAGYKVSRSHYNASALKTNAPPSIIWDIVSDYLNNEAEAPANIKKDQRAERILSRKASFEVSYTHKDSRAILLKKEERVFLPNPEENWGPKSRAGKKRKRLDDS